MIIGLDFMPAPAQGPTGPLLAAALAVPIVAVGLRVLLQALAKSGSPSVGMGTQLAPAEAPEGLEIATFAGRRGTVFQRAEILTYKFRKTQSVLWISFS